jgi:broad specificity phosphatase PhoE
MEIVLVRHGKPAAVPSELIAGHEIGRWCARYDSLGISRELPPPAALQRLMITMRCVVASNLKRSVESAEWFAPPGEIRIDPDLREAALPQSLWVPIRMPPGVWVVLARLAWWVNIGSARESLATTRSRASRVAEGLCALALEKGTVGVVGHGAFNRFIATQLRRRGWRGPPVLPIAYWAIARFVRTEQAVGEGS